MMRGVLILFLVVGVCSAARLETHILTFSGLRKRLTSVVSSEQALLRLRGGAASLVSVIQTAAAGAGAKFEKLTIIKGVFLDISFEHGSTYRFHSEWLRDACRDENYVSMAAGERRLGKIQILMEESSDIKAIEATIEEGGTMSILFDNGEKCIYAPEMLAAFATSAAAKHISGPTIRNKDVEWVKPFTGVPDAPAPSTINHWRGQTGGGEIPAMQWTDVMTPEGNLEMLKHLLAGHGAVRVVTKGMSEAGVTTLLRFSDFTCNGLQKDPSRAEANWLIVRKENAASVSYNPSTRLNNHSDQSLPNYGIPALLLVFHYAEGWGANTLVDSFAAAEDLRREDPEAFHLLSTYGNDQERDLLASRQDAKQGHTASLCLTSAAKIIQLDSAGGVKRIQYNEVFRTPLSVPFEHFKAWYAAYLKFGRMLESRDYEREMPMDTGDIMIVNNWRVLHGRAGSRDGVTDIGKISPDRCLVGGTVTRENAFSRARALLKEVEDVQLFGPHALSA